ncbi:uncharacterized protein LOC136032049 isoform X2 [Artemia franciscana]|uniref:uncharacterized protein LOC136032049 isoform X2 n=1 Tax=Artemia franciscana TaxID=6661 RepID=UPI0032DAD2AF
MFAMDEIWGPSRELNMAFWPSCHFNKDNCLSIIPSQKVIEAFVFSNIPRRTIVQRIHFTKQGLGVKRHNVSFSMKTPNDYFDVNVNTGDIFVKQSTEQLFSSHKERTLVRFGVLISLEDTENCKTSVMVQIWIKRKAVCNREKKKLCFNRGYKTNKATFCAGVSSEDITLTSALSSPSLRSNSCRNMRVSYHIIQRSSIIYILPSKSSTEVTVYAKRDFYFKNISNYSFMIECHIQDINSNFSERHVLFSTLRLQRAFWEVRKKRDLLGENLHFDLYLDNKGLEKHGSHYINIPYNVASASSSDFLVTIVPITNTDLNQTFRIKQKFWEKAHEGKSFLSLELIPLVNRHIGDSLSFSIRVVNKNRETSSAKVAYVTLHPGSLPVQGTTSANNNSHIETIDSKNLTVKASACEYKYLGKPLQKLFPTKDFKQSNIAFSLVDPDTPFGITRKTGIFYVADSKALRNRTINEYRIEVKWSSPLGENSTFIHIFVAEETGFWNPTKECSGEEFCAETKSELECTQLGNVLGTDFKCHWLTRSESIHGISRNYETCTSNKETCPDGECDELETQHWELCPQDCTRKLYSFPGKLGTGQQGIKSGIGVCSCDYTGACSCIPEHESLLESEDKEDEDSSTDQPFPTSESLIVARVAESDDKCGLGCYTFIFLAGFGFIGTIFGTVATILARHGAVMNTKSRHLGSTISLSAVPSDYIEERERGLSGDQTTTALIPQGLGSDVVIEQKWAVNREHLMLEKVLGEGEFGKVMQARLLTDKGLKIVAVKMAKVNRGGDAETAIQDLWSEFSLLKDVDHLHVIRLIGACSTNNELMLVLEYAEHGSLRNYLRKSRTEAVRHTIELDYPVSPRDILCFAWQISKGMAYLASMKLVHRDLAARNVLVANGNIAKISDFGLTRDIYEEDAYFKRSKGRVPVKWMAPESLADQLYTTKSDVWSFGILLWELCTLGSTPYPGLGPEKLYRLLKSGYRMERPDNCSQELYSIMLHCWKDSPSDRPSFHELALILDRMLADGVNYLDIFSLIVNNPGYIGCLESEEEDDETLASKDSGKFCQNAGDDSSYLMPAKIANPNLVTS